MSIELFISGIALALVIASLHGLGKAYSQLGTSMTKQKNPFIIGFPDGQWSPAMTVPADSDTQEIVKSFNLLSPRPTIFVSGGASLMSEADIQQTRHIIDVGLAAFAQRHRITVIDGGTEAGVMEMIGSARKNNNYNFPLIGVAPMHKVSYPGYEGEDSEASLEMGHSHFVLVDVDEWGGESQTIIALAKQIAAGKAPIIGILINGGKIAEREAYLATAQGEDRMPLLVIDGSGRAADSISTAFRTQQAESDLIRAIIKGGDIRITALADGVPALIEELEKVFGK